MANQKNQKGPPNESTTKLTVEAEEYLGKTVNPETIRRVLKKTTIIMAKVPSKSHLYLQRILS